MNQQHTRTSDFRHSFEFPVLGPRRAVVDGPPDIVTGVRRRVSSWWSLTRYLFVRKRCGRCPRNRGGGGRRVGDNFEKFKNSNPHVKEKGSSFSTNRKLYQHACGQDRHCFAEWGAVGEYRTTFGERPNEQTAPLIGENYPKPKPQKRQRHFQIAGTNSFYKTGIPRRRLQICERDVVDGSR